MSQVSNAIKRVVSAIQPAGGVSQPARQAAGPAVEVLKTRMRIRELSVERPDVVAYMAGIAADKREVALVHAIEVGITEILVRRKRSGH